MQLWKKSTTGAWEVLSESSEDDVSAQEPLCRAACSMQSNHLFGPALVGFALIVWGFSLYRAGRFDPRLDPADVDAPRRHPSDVVRFRGAGLHEPGAQQNQGLAASPDAGLDQNLGARASAGQWRRRRDAAVRGRFSLGPYSTASPSRNAATSERREYHPSRADGARSGSERWPMWRCCSCIPC